MKKILILSIFLFSKTISNHLIGQEIKKIKQNYSYTDAFEDIKDGEAEYEYYLDENEKKKLNGNFKIFKRYQDISISVSGNYINNKKNGLWIYKYITYEIGVNVNTRTTKNGVTYNSSVNGVSTEIPDKIKTHEIIYRNDTIIDKFIYNLKEKKNGQFTTISELKIGLNSKNKTYTGPVECMVIPALETRKITLTGNFDEKGAPHGLWLCNNIKEDESNLESNKLLKLEANYDHGILTYEKVTQIGTGEFLKNYTRKEPEIKDSTITAQIVYFRNYESDLLHQQYDSASSVFAFNGRFDIYNKVAEYKNNYEESPHYYDFSNFTRNDQRFGTFNFIYNLLPSLPASSPYIYALEKDNYASLIGRKVYLKKIDFNVNEKIINYKNLFQSKTPSWASSSPNRKSLENWYGYCNSINYYFKEYTYIEDINKLLNNKYPLDRYADRTYPFVYEDGTKASEIAGKTVWKDEFTKQDPALPFKNWQKHYYANTKLNEVINFQQWYNNVDRFMTSYLKDKYLLPTEQLLNLYNKRYFITYLPSNKKIDNRRDDLASRQPMIYGYKSTAFTKRFYNLTNAIIDIYKEDALETIIDSVILAENIASQQHGEYSTQSSTVKIIKREYAVNLIKLASIEKSMIDTFNFKLSNIYLNDTITYINLISKYLPIVQAFYTNIDRAFRIEFLDLYNKIQDKKYFKNAYAIINYKGINNCNNFEDMTKYLEAKNKIIDRIVKTTETFSNDANNNSKWEDEKNKTSININLFSGEKKVINVGEKNNTENLDLQFYDAIKDTISDEYRTKYSYDSLRKITPVSGSYVNGNWIKTDEGVLKGYKIELDKISKRLNNKRGLNSWQLFINGCNYTFNKITYTDLTTKNYELLNSIDTLLFKQMLDSIDLNLLLVKENRKEILNLASKVNNEIPPLQQQIFIKYKVAGIRLDTSILNSKYSSSAPTVKKRVFVSNVYNKKIIFMAWKDICYTYTQDLIDNADKYKLRNTKTLVLKYDKIKLTADALLKIADKIDTHDIEEQLKGKSADEAMELILNYQ